MCVKDHRRLVEKVWLAPHTLPTAGEAAQSTGPVAGGRGRGPRLMSTYYVLAPLTPHNGPTRLALSPLPLHTWED